MCNAKLRNYLNLEKTSICSVHVVAKVTISPLLSFHTWTTEIPTNIPETWGRYSFLAESPPFLSHYGQYSARLGIWLITEALYVTDSIGTSDFTQSLGNALCTLTVQHKYMDNYQYWRKNNSFFSFFMQKSKEWAKRIQMIGTIKLQIKVSKIICKKGWGTTMNKF